MTTKHPPQEFDRSPKPYDDDAEDVILTDDESQPGKEPATFRVDKQLLSDVKDAVVQLSGPPEFLTLSAFIDRALRRELDRLRKKYNKGKTFPGRGARQLGGRPIKRD